MLSSAFSIKQLHIYQTSSLPPLIRVAGHCKLCLTDFSPPCGSAITATQRRRFTPTVFFHRSSMVSVTNLRIRRLSCISARRHPTMTTTTKSLSVSHLTGHHGFCKTEETRNEASLNEEEEEDNYDLEAYEALMLHATLPLSGAGERTADVSPAAETSSPVDQLVEEVYTALPATGAALPLTHLTPLVDTEAICHQFGSLLSFLRLFPHRFACAQSPVDKRWQVSRAGRRNSSVSLGHGDGGVATASSAATRQDGGIADLHSLDIAAMLVEEELQIRRSTASSQPSPVAARPTSSPPTRVRLTPADRVAPSPLHRWWPAIAALLPGDGSSCRITALRAMLPLAITEKLQKSGGSGLVRCFKQDYASASEHLALVDNGLSFCVAAAVSLHGMKSWTPSRLDGDLPVVDCGAGTMPVAEGYATDAWLAEIDLDDGGGVVVDDGLQQTRSVEDPTDSRWTAETEAYSSADPPASLEPHVGMVPVLYAGMEDEAGAHSLSDAFTGIDLRRLAVAPVVVPPKRDESLLLGAKTASKVPPPVASAAIKANPRKRKKTASMPPEELMALHTSMAEARGWPTPSDILSYLVECVPTFFIPESEVRLSDALIAVVGRATSMKTMLRIYTYFVETTIADDGVRQVRLSPTTAHPHRGAADVHYPAWSPAQTAADTGDDAGGPDRGGSAKERTSLPTAENTPPPGYLRRSAATGAFPVLRVLPPIKSTAIPPLGYVKREHTGVALTKPKTKDFARLQATAMTSGSLFSSEKRVSASSTIAVSSPSSPLSAAKGIGYPFLPASLSEPFHTWPLLARAACIIPYNRYVSTTELLASDVAAYLSADELATLVGYASGAASPSPLSTTQLGTAESHAFLYLPKNVSRHRGSDTYLRLRPLWLAPGSTAELDASSLPAGVVQTLRPAWTSVDRFILRIGDSASTDLQQMAKQRLQAADISPREALTQLLRDCGRCCWVSDDGAKLRRFMARAELDDLTHLALSLLYSFASSREAEPLEVVLDRVQQSLPSPVSTSPSIGLLGMLRAMSPADQQNLLQQHRQLFEVHIDTGATVSSASPANRSTLLRRRTSFISFAKKP